MTRDEEWLLREKYHGEQTEGFHADCGRLASGEPVAYVIGWQPFLDTKIDLDSKPLIPRPETEWWTKRAIERIRARHEPRILDLCAGSGAIGVAVLKAIPPVRVDFAEIEKSHHGTIIDNICDNDTDYTRTRVFGGDLFAEIPNGTTYDFILTNPPYIDPELDRAERNVKEFEPHRALYGGAAGLEIIERIVRDAHKYLTPKGELWIEHEPEQSERIKSLARDLGYRTCETYQDQFGVLRLSILAIA